MVFTKYAVETGSGGMIYTPSCRHSKVNRGEFTDNMEVALVYFRKLG
jgi:hypothetical protein